MKYLTIAALAALLALCTSSQASAGTIATLSFGASTTDETLEFSTPFTESLFSPAFLNSIFSATLTDDAPPTAASATVTADVYLEVAGDPASKTLVSNETLALNLATTTSTTQTTETLGYPATFYAGPSGTFNELVVDVTSSSLDNAFVSFTGLAELESVPEPSTWAMLLGGVSVLLVAARFRRTARQA